MRLWTCIGPVIGISLPCAVDASTRISLRPDSMSTELASVRAEVKAWERNFKQENGREPTVDDIRKQPSVGVSCPIIDNRVSNRVN